MKIAYVLNTYPQPSHSFIRREIQALERSGFDILRLAMRPADTPLVDAGDLAEAAKTQYVLRAGGVALILGFLGVICVHPLCTIRALVLAWRMGGRSEVGRLKHLIYLIEAGYVLRRCRAEHVRHVHAHFGTNAATVACLTHALGGPGYSFTVHGPEEFDAPRALSLGPKIETARFVVGVSAFGRSQLSRWVDHAHWPRLQVVHCGIEADRFADPRPMPGGALRLVSIGRFVEQKGQMTLIPAMRRICDALPEARLHLIGDGPMRGEIEAAIAGAGLGDNIHLTGWLDETQIRSELDSAHALIMPSFAEGLPMVVMEAMAAARPVIATYIAGTPELVLPGKTGWLVPAGDPVALAEAALELAALGGDARAALSHAARERVLQRHDVDTEAARLAGHIRASVDAG